MIPKRVSDGAWSTTAMSFTSEDKPEAKEDGTTATSSYNATPSAWPSSPPNRRSSPAPDTTSPVYPGRPIRPMPKRRIRDRLSAEHAATIDYPPPPASETPIFGYPYTEERTVIPYGRETPMGRDRLTRALRAGSHELVGRERSEPCADCGHEHPDHSQSHSH